jgi:hypothetical protein
MVADEREQEATGTSHPAPTRGIGLRQTGRPDSDRHLGCPPFCTLEAERIFLISAAPSRQIMSAAGSRRSGRKPSTVNSPERAGDERAAVGGEHAPEVRICLQAGEESVADQCWAPRTVVAPAPSRTACQIKMAPPIPAAAAQATGALQRH